ncbi:hypothetical protein Adt_32938 [Abeliophyllum distichum]|uniref:Uncharacterized protein n=1 Tax=Abeliophyllum distichum TaxID=126358 RepID=A0ABD1QUU1_9LAMI
MMEKISRKWRKSRRSSQFDDDNNFSLPTRDDFRPIDSQEQEQLIRSFEKNLAQQSLLWKRVFAGLLFCYAAFLIFSIFQQAYYPWELRYHAYFMYEVDSWGIMSSEWAAVVVCFMVITGLLHNSKHHRRWFWYSCFPGILSAIFWLHHMLRLAKFRWDILWLPFGPLSASGICLYVDHLLNESSEEVRKLREYMYAYKAS